MALTSTERKELAARVRVNEQYLYQCLSGRRDMDPAEAVRVERESNRAVTRFDLCQRRGAVIWPELAANESNAGFSDLPVAVQQRAIAQKG